MGQAGCHPWTRDGLLRTRRKDKRVTSRDNCILSAFVGFLVYDGWRLRANIPLASHHLFTVTVYGFAIIVRLPISSHNRSLWEGLLAAMTP
eukprot:COSAG01_NODE_10444_length_2164_cov_1.852785_1_plen_91_part_00